MFGRVSAHSATARKMMQNVPFSVQERTVFGSRNSVGFFRSGGTQSTYYDPRTCFGDFRSIPPPHEKRCKTGPFQYPNPLFSVAETRTDFFASEPPDRHHMTPESVWETFRAFCHCTKNNAKRARFGTRTDCFRVPKLGRILSLRRHPINVLCPQNMFRRVS